MSVDSSNLPQMKSWASEWACIMQAIRLNTRPYKEFELWLLSCQYHHVSIHDENTLKERGCTLQYYWFGHFPKMIKFFISQKAKIRAFLCKIESIVVYPFHKQFILGSIMGGWFDIISMILLALGPFLSANCWTACSRWWCFTSSNGRLWLSRSW